MAALGMSLLSLVALLLLGISLPSCTLIASEPLGFVLYPEDDAWERRADGIWKAPADGRICISFDSPVDRDAAASLIRVFSQEEEIPLKIHWEDTTLFVGPMASWERGRRYLMYARGIVRSLDGREDGVDCGLSFFHESEEAFVLLSYTPQNGAVLDWQEEALPCLSLLFSSPPDPASLEESLSLGGFGALHFEWEEEGRSCRVYPRDQSRPRPWTSLRWSLSGALRDVDGTRLLTGVSASFVCGGNLQALEILRSFRAARVDGEWIETGDGLGSLRAHELPGLEFSTSLDERSLEDAFFLRPHQALRPLLLDERRVVLIPLSPLEAGHEWALYAATSLRDSTGLHLATEYRECFSTEPSRLVLDSVHFASHDLDPVEPGLWRARLAVLPGAQHLRLGFSLPLDPQSRSALSGRIRIEPLFPASLSYPRIASVIPLGDTHFELLIFDMGREAGSSWYRITISGAGGGLRGIGWESGEDWTIELELHS